jgi:CBS domain containing-hemolysin-like protein
MTGFVVTGIIIILLASALITAAEAAVFHLSASRVRTLEEEGFRGAAALARLRAQPGGIRPAIRLTTAGLNLAALAAAVAFGSLSWGWKGILAEVAVGILAIVLATDLAPRVAAARAPVRLALVSAPLLERTGRMLSLIISPLVRLEGALSGTGDGDTAEERELREIQELGQDQGVLGVEENLLVERAFRLDELTTWDVMTPRVDVFAWQDTLKLSDIVKELPELPYSRVPVYGESVDDVSGVLYVREAYEALVAGKADTSLRELAHDPFFVPGSLSLSRLLQDFQARRIHLGIVADEFGGIDGLVTLEDVLEELVGEIVDEWDVDEEELTHVSQDELVAEAAADLRDINHAFQVSLPLAEHRSLNGFILEELGRVPDAGETLERAGVRIEILEATDTQVVSARLTRLPENGTEAPQPLQ